MCDAMTKLTEEEAHEMQADIRELRSWKDNLAGQIKVWGIILGGLCSVGTILGGWALSAAGKIKDEQVAMNRSLDRLVFVVEEFTKEPRFTPKDYEISIARDLQPIREEVQHAVAMEDEIDGNRSRIDLNTSRLDQMDKLHFRMENVDDNHHNRLQKLEKEKP